MDRRPILQLPASLVNRIAAGEVIERPASVVKELVENALDAGATDILVEIEDGGRELIRVVDNGCGIPADQLKMAFAEHATNKLSCDDDLFAISTMGFRGEALASIGAVSHAKILSRTAESAAAYEIENRGGNITDVQAAAGNVGSMIEVRNLFFNVPARRKFLKGTDTESGHVSEMVMRLALPHPAAILMINMPAADVDVNVHPTKAEVRFKDSGRLHGLVLGGIREKLLGSDLTPNAKPGIDYEQSLGMREKLAEFLKVGGSESAAPLAPSPTPQWTLHTSPPPQQPMNWPVATALSRPPFEVQ